jgi:hypothetical protein
MSLNYDAWVWWSALTKKEQDKIMEIMCETYCQMQEF